MECDGHDVAGCLDLLSARQCLSPRSSHLETMKAKAKRNRGGQGLRPKREELARAFLEFASLLAKRGKQKFSTIFAELAILGFQAFDLAAQFGNLSVTLIFLSPFFSTSLSGPFPLLTV